MKHLPRARKIPSGFSSIRPKNPTAGRTALPNPSVTMKPNVKYENYVDKTTLQAHSVRTYERRGFQVQTMLEEDCCARE